MHGCLPEVPGRADVRLGQCLPLPALLPLGRVHNVVHLGVVMVTVLPRVVVDLGVLDVRGRHRGQRRAFNIQTDGQMDGGCGS